MELNPAQCYAALSAHDARFDGHFYVGVSTTRVYCRPVCRVRRPGADRCQYFANAASAEAAGFRPCLRCRPELAPGTAPIDTARSVAWRAAARIQAGALNTGNLADLAQGLGFGERQLRRLVVAEFGVSPVALAQTQRLLLAKQLLTDTTMSVVELADASGFGSLRQFNRLFARHYRLRPLDLRRRAPAVADQAAAIELRLAYRPPLAWTQMLRFMQPRAAPRCEAWEDGRYWRTVALADCQGWVALRPLTGRDQLALSIAPSLLPVLPGLLARVRRWFDLDANPQVIDAQLAQDHLLAPSVRRSPGMRLPGTLDGFEMTLRAVVGQQISVKAASTVYARLVDSYGLAVATPIAGLDRTGPQPQAIACASLAELIAHGLTQRRAATLHAIAQAQLSGAIDLSPAADPAELRRALIALPGVGPWTAEYVALRVLGDPDAFPASDLGLLKSAGVTTPRALQTRSQSWRPWRAYAAIHLWQTYSGG